MSSAQSLSDEDTRLGDLSETCFLVAQELFDTLEISASLVVEVEKVSSQLSKPFGKALRSLIRNVESICTDNNFLLVLWLL